MKRLDHYWYSKNAVAWMLLPLSWLFCCVAVLRRKMYQKHLLASYALPVPVIIIGNITVGGSGKTPLLIALCEYLHQQGYRPGVISRGYGASISGEHTVSDDDTATNCGDEPVLIYQHTGCPVVIGKDRVAAAIKLLDENDCDVILSDDGMQHYRLRRTVEIAVVDALRKFGNGFCLPAGPLREPQSRLSKADMVVYHGESNNDYHFFLQPGEAVNLLTGEQKSLASFSTGRIHAVAGIGHPERYFSQLRGLGLDVVEHAYPDHHDYSAADISFADDAAVLVTEKDAVKIRQLVVPADTHDAVYNVWAVPVAAKLSDPLRVDLIELIRQRR